MASRSALLRRMRCSGTLALVSSEPSRNVDTLYTVPLAEFTRHRNELAARLRQAGRRDEASRRPAPTTAPPGRAADRARQRASPARTFRRPFQLLDAQGAGRRTQRRALQVLMRSTEGILRRGGFTPTAQAAQRISGTLLWAATDREARQALLQGRVTEERQAPGFEALGGARAPRAPERATDRREPPDEAPRSEARIRVAERRSRARAAEEHRARAALEARRAARAQAEDLATKARALEEEAAARAREAAEAARVVIDLQRQLGQVEARARERRSAARKAAVAAKRARRDAMRLAAKLQG